MDLIIVDREYAHLLDGFDPSVRRIIDEDTDATEGELSGEFDDAVRQGLEYDAKFGNGWEGLEMEAQNEEDVIGLAYTSGTTAKPKVGSIPTASSSGLCPMLSTATDNISRELNIPTAESTSERLQTASNPVSPATPS